MYRLTALPALLLAIACAAPLPTPTPTGAPTPLISPTPTDSPVPTSPPTVPPRQPPATPVPTASLSPSMIQAAESALEGWTPICQDVELTVCHGVAALFVNNLARNWQTVHDQSGGRVTVVPRPQCPYVQDYMDPSFCWQASAPTRLRTVCMVVGRQLPVVPADAQLFGFGQVGGDDLTGRAIPPDPQYFEPCA